jgi:predicted AlkP superfamily phosphohydrolase/phosphomutase
VGGGSYWLGSRSRVSRAAGKKVIIIGIDGMDPGLCETLMNRGELKHLSRLRAAGGFSRLGTSIPPQSPVAWASFINGAGPGSHGIFDFMHRHPHEPFSEHSPFYAGAETLPGDGYWEVDEHRLPLDFWPFNHRPAETVLRRQGEPFWDFLDQQGIPSTFYDLPCNYPPSPSHHGHHRCLCGMGTPDLQGSYGTYQHFATNGPEPPENVDGGRKSRLRFERHTARATLVGPPDGLRSDPRPTDVEFLVHHDPAAGAAMIEVQGQRILLKKGEWSPWTRIDFTISTPWFVPSRHASGICRFYLQAVAPEFRLYVTPLNIDPADPALTISEPASFVQEMAERLGPFYTAGFQEDYQARKTKVFDDDEFVTQATMVLEERLRQFDDALQNYDDGLLFFYFSSSDLQSHMLWWNGGDHPTRSDEDAQKYFGHIERLYGRLDKLVGDLFDRYGSSATIFVMSDHGFANFGRQFNLNTWLRDNGFLGPADCKAVRDADWSKTIAYGLGINGLYLNLKGREPNGIVEPGEMREARLDQLMLGLLAYQDPVSGQQVISSVYRADEVYKGDATALAPDLIVGYAPGYRASWDTIKGELSENTLDDNLNAWSADHCMDARVVPGILFCNRSFRAKSPSLVDLAPSILAEFGLPTPASMVGKNIFT